MQRCKKGTRRCVDHKCYHKKKTVRWKILRRTRVRCKRGRRRCGDTRCHRKK